MGGAALFDDVIIIRNRAHPIHIEEDYAMAVSSLFETSLQAVMRDFHHHEAALRYLPSLVKTRVARVMAKRGLLIEGNMKLVSVS